MAFKRKYKFNIIDYLYYAGRIRRIHKWHMPLETIFFAIFGYIPPFLIMRFLAQIIPLWLLLFLFFGWVWVETEILSMFEKNYFTKTLKERIKTTSGFSCYCRFACIRSI